MEICFAIEIKITGIVKVGTIGMKDEFVLEKKLMGCDRFGKVKRIVKQGLVDFRGQGSPEIASKFGEIFHRSVGRVFDFLME